METAIGVFSARERAEEAVRELLDRKVPQESIVFLTRSETEAKIVGKELGATAGGFVGVSAGMSAGVAAATLMAVPGIGQVFALGAGNIGDRSQHDDGRDRKLDRQRRQAERAPRGPGRHGERLVQELRSRAWGPPHGAQRDAESDLEPLGGCARDDLRQQ